MSEGGGGRTGVPFADEPTDVGRFEDDELIRKLLAFTFSLLLWCHKYEHLMLLLQPKDNVPGPSRGFDYSSSRRSGRSYRQLPAEVGLPYVKCMQNFYLGNVAEW